MAKQRLKKKRPAKPAVGTSPPPRTLAEFTERGFDALGKRRSRSAGRAGKPDKKSQAFAEAVERLKADYGRVLKRR